MALGYIAAVKYRQIAPPRASGPSLFPANFTCVRTVKRVPSLFPPAVPLPPQRKKSSIQKLFSVAHASVLLRWHWRTCCFGDTCISHLSVTLLPKELAFANQWRYLLQFLIVAINRLVAGQCKRLLSSLPFTNNRLADISIMVPEDRDELRDKCLDLLFGSDS